MPYASEAQRRYMHTQHPQIAERFDRETPRDARLPEHVHEDAKARAYRRMAEET